MIATTSEDLVTLRERHRQLSDRVAELSAQAIDITGDIAAARTDWTDSVERCGEDSTLLAQRVHLREAELLDNRQAAEHLQRLLTEVDAEIADITARQQLAEDAAAYRTALASYAGLLPGLPDALGDAVEVITAALDGLLAEVAAARTGHDQLSSTSAQLRQRAQRIGAAVDAPELPSWSDPLERVHGKESATRQLMLALLQQRGMQSVISEITRLIMLDVEAKRKAAR